MGQPEQILPEHVAVPTKLQTVKWQKIVKRVALSACFVYLTLSLPRYFVPRQSEAASIQSLQQSGEICAQVDPVYPTKHAELAAKADEIYSKDEFRLKVAEALGAAIRIPTDVYDEYPPVGEDDSWDKFAKFHEYLAGAFPNVHQTLNLTKVNKWALVYHWQGSDESLKPLMLTAHQDVVPVLPSTLDQWLQPPFSGYFDGEWIWGRGSADQKSGVIGTLTAVETLIKEGFKPSRSVILAYGFDEERGGRHGAGHMGKYLLETYGADSIALLIDEGGGLSQEGDTLFASPNVGEKGYIDVRMDVVTPGGHSSVPEPHTGIGYLSALITLLEGDPIPPSLSRTNPYYEHLQCLAQYADLAPGFSKDIKASITDDAALERVEAQIVSTKQGRAMIGTTQAADIIFGGVKVNALPEKVYAIVNHRISVDSSPRAVKDRFVNILHPYAQQMNLGFTAFGVNYTSVGPSVGHITLSDAFGTALEPAPVSPHVKGDKAWDLLAGTIKGQYEGVTISPSIIGGNTDTRWYWPLSGAIYRYAALKAADNFNGGHTINEAIRASGVVERIVFYTRMILNADESDI